MSRSQEEILEDYKQRLQDLIGRKPKPNPNHYPIINKWNYKYIYKPHRQEIFETLEKAADELLEPVMEDIIKKHLSSLDLNFGEALTSYFIRHPEIYNTPKEHQDSFSSPVSISIPDVIFGNNCSFTDHLKYVNAIQYRDIFTVD